MSGFFLLIGFSITEKNAQYLLSGYNTMSAQEKARFDLSAYLQFFKIFHVGLAIVFLLVSLLLYFFAPEEIIALGMSVVPLMGYLYLLWQSKNYYQDRKLPVLTKIGLGFLLVILILLVVLFLFL
jgi:hypothetical protein